MSKRKHETVEEYRDRQRPYHRAYQRANKGRWVQRKRPRNLYCRFNWQKYGIINRNGTDFTHTDYDVMFAFQNGCCALCGKHQSELRYSLAVDHNHSTGVARGLLCQNCNWKVSVIEDADFNEKCRRYFE